MSVTGRDAALHEAHALVCDRLREWLDGVQLGRYERPQFRNPSELKSAVRTVLAELDACRRNLAEERARTTRVGDIALRQHQDWMHFHETAMSDPFAAEREAQAFCASVIAECEAGKEQPA